jgi:glycosyltransferase involved in cell wall biosynthesis
MMPPAPTAAAILDRPSERGPRHAPARPAAPPAAAAAARLVVVQPALPEYRVGFFAALAGLWPGEVLVVHGARRADGVANDTRPAPYRRAEVGWRASPLGPQLSWHDLRGHLDGAGLVIVPGDPHCLASHRLLAARRLGRLAAPLVAFSQYRGADARWLPTLVKPWWHRLFDGLILYTHVEAEQYRALGHPADRLTWLDNGLARLPDPPREDELARRHADGPLVCLGRHIAKNRFDLALRGFAAYRRGGGRRRLVLIGDGPMTPELRALAAELGDAVEFAGAVYDPAELDARLRGACAAIHPLAMGLSLNTAFGYGLPVIACDDARRHMPEFWIWQDGRTGLGFAAARGREDDAVPGIAAALWRCEALGAAEYAGMARAAHDAVVPLTTTAMATRVHGLCRALFARGA